MNRCRSLLFGVPLMALGASPAFAQAQPAQYQSATTVKVRPGAVAEYEEYVKKIVGGAAKIGSPQAVLAFQVRFGPGFTYTFVSPFAKWEELERWPSIPEILAKAYGEVEGARLLKTGRAAIESVENEVFRLLPEHSTRMRAFDPSDAFVNLVRTEIVPETEGDYRRYLAKVKAAQEKTEGPTTIRRVSVQGRASTYWSATLLKKLGDRDAQPAMDEVLAKAYGEDEARELLAASLRSVKKRDIWLLAYRADLSRPGAK